MHKTIISDTSCFIILAKINELELLHQLYGEVYTTVEIAEEYDEPLPDWVVVVNIKDKLVQQILELQIDKGESSALTLALETPNCTLIIDDLKARKIALQLNIKITGTIGIIIKAKLNKIIPSIIPILNKIKETNFFISPELEFQALQEANEVIK
ncbi:MAG: DUF3368 domain-containing protein [Bacteroidetes bacterium]|nr:DUF3368 domain-containing protein [Bacteroidota bacterium]